MKKRTPEEDLSFHALTADSIVLIIDATTKGKDFQSTPFSFAAPSGIIQAHIMNSLLNEDFIHYPSVSGTIIFYCVLTGLLILTVLLSSKRVFLLLRWGLIILMLIWCLFAFIVLKTMYSPVLPFLYLFFSIISLQVYETFMDQRRTAHRIIKVLEEKPSDMVMARFNEQCSHYNITPRQKEIIFLTHKSLETKEIAYKLTISERTVSNHLTNIYEKTKARNKLDLVKIFFSW